MGSLAISEKVLNKYFKNLESLDTNSKKRLIIKLTESIEPKSNGKFDLKSLFGAWEDTKDSDEIIKQIKDSRVEKIREIL